MKVCPKCSKEWPDKVKFCPHDGARLEQRNFEPTPDAQKPTVALSDEELSRIQAAGERREVASSKTEGRSSSARGAKKRFSETKWFMVGDHIKDEEIEASDLPIEDLQRIYTKTGELPEDVRRRYSLRDAEEQAKKKKKGDD